MWCGPVRTSRAAMTPRGDLRSAHGAAGPQDWPGWSEVVIQSRVCATAPLAPASGPAATALLRFYAFFCFVFCFFLESTCKRDQTVFVSLYLTHFTAHNALKVQPRFRKWQGFLLFHGRIVLCFARLCTAFSLSIHPSRATSCSGMGVQRSF